MVPFGSAIKTFHADGTIVSAGQNAADGSESAGYGNWKKVGDRTIKLSAVVYGTGFIALVSEVVTFADDFDSYTGTLVTAVYDAGTDVLDPDAVPFFCTFDAFGEVVISGTRLPVAFPACPCPTCPDLGDASDSDSDSDSEEDSDSDSD